MADEQKLPLKAFLQVLTSKNLPIARAMAVAGKIYKEYNTPTRLGELTDPKLTSLGVSDKDDRRLVLSTLNAAGYRAAAVENAKAQEAKKRRAAAAADDGPSEPPKNGEPSQPKKAPLLPLPRKRKRAPRIENEYLPAPTDEGATLDSLDFHELLDEDALAQKSVVVNRAPVMMAWACVVAERLGFTREEALSIASVYTEMNAVSKGVSLGLYDKTREGRLEAAHGGAQPYVELLGRRVPLYQTAAGGWRAFTTSEDGAGPGAAYGYITRALRQTAPAVLGAMRLLADSFADPAELNRAGYALYADFRPEVDGWGKRGELRCAALLALRKSDSGSAARGGGGGARVVAGQAVKYETPAGSPAGPTTPSGDLEGDGPSSTKRHKTDSDDDPDDALFDDFTAEELNALP
ncbi:hypothetical protein BC834DRAFT_868576 [Gloeopeniophorella convolvens]|nr:hypothetical protein BC834DRAFT_868576 [Gloeopeniophorella convolvens]